MRNTTRHTSVRIAALAAAAGLALAGCGSDGEDLTGTGGSVSFAGLADGDTVSSPVTVDMTADGVTIEPADAGVNEGAGHLHVMIDTGCVPAGETIPADDAHRHFGDGSTTADLDLEPGEHTLCLQLADGEHVATDITQEITITVE